MKKSIIDFNKLVIVSYKEWVKDRAKGLAASISYYELLSFAPLIGFLLFISLQLFGYEKTTQDVVPILKVIFPEQFVNVIKFMLFETRHIKPSDLTQLSILAGIMLGLATIEYFAQIMDSIEAIWDVRTDKANLFAALRRIYQDVKATIISLFILIIFLIIRVLIPHPFVTDYELSFFEKVIFISGRILFGATLIFSLSLYWLKYFPPVKLSWKEVIPGAFMLTFLQLIGRLIMRSQMNNHPDPGVAESLIVVLIWFYYSNLVLLYAAEFSKVYILKKRGTELSSFTLTDVR